MTGTEKLIGFLMKTQRPLDEHYLNEGAAWADEAAVLAGIPSISRSPYKFVNIAGVLYWFKSNLTELEKVTIPALVAAGDVSIEDAGSLFEATNVEAALAELMTAFKALSDEFDTFKNNNFVVNNYTVYNANTYSVEFTCTDISLPVIISDLINATLILVTRDGIPIKLTELGFNAATGLITPTPHLFLNETLYIVYKKSSIA